MINDGVIKVMDLFCFKFRFKNKINPCLPLKNNLTKYDKINFNKTFGNLRNEFLCPDKFQKVNLSRCRSEPFRWSFEEKNDSWPITGRLIARVFSRSVTRTRWILLLKYNRRVRVSSNNAFCRYSSVCVAEDGNANDVSPYYRGQGSCDARTWLSRYFRIPSADTHPLYHQHPEYPLT